MRSRQDPEFIRSRRHHTFRAGTFFRRAPRTRGPRFYVMGCRNPFRFTVDEVTGWVYWRSGTDATADSPTRGRRVTTNGTGAGARKFGWPYFVGNNKTLHSVRLQHRNFRQRVQPGSADEQFSEQYRPTNLPPAQPAWLWYPYDSSPEFPELDGTGAGRHGGPTIITRQT